MAVRSWVPDGLYRLVKWQEDGNPVFPGSDMVVEIRGGEVINLLTGRRCPLRTVARRSLFGPLTGPYDGTRLRHLRRIDVATRHRDSDTTIPGFC